MEVLIILLIAVLITLVKIRVNDPKRYLRVDPVLLKDDGMVVCMRNISRHSIVLEDLGVAWKTGKNHSHCVLFEEKFHELLPGDVFTETLPFGIPLYEGEYGDLIPDIRESKTHEILFELSVDGKKKGFYGSTSSIKTELINQMT